jgi:hypothetical protein
MSANVYWRPVKPTSGHDLGLAAPQHFLENMEKAFGNREPTLGQDSIPILQGLSIGSGGDMAGNPYDKLIEALEKYGEIELEARY